MLNKRLINVLWRVLERQIFLALLLFLMTVVLPTNVFAVALGYVKVSSHLNEPFVAEIRIVSPQNGKTTPSFSVDIATPKDYHVLGVYYPPILRYLFLNIEHGQRGFRAVVTSTDRMQSSFFNLILKITKKNATIFKKYAIFLDLPLHARANTTPAEPLIASSKHKKNEVLLFNNPVSSHPIARQSRTEASLKWARLKRYGPIVYGDTLYNVAWRMRAARSPYTLRQVMVALFRKNTGKFMSGNMNMMMPGAYLNAPSEDEVAATTYPQAKKIIAEHLKRWKKKRAYHEELNAQNKRYGVRVHLAQQKNINKKLAIHNTDAVSAGIPQKSEKERLLEQLQQAHTKITALTAKLSTAGNVAANTHIKKLELRLARMVSSLDDTRQEVSRHMGIKAAGLLYFLAGFVVILLGVILYLFVRKPAVQSSRYFPSDEEILDTHDTSDQQNDDNTSASQEDDSLQDQAEEETPQVAVTNDGDEASTTPVQKKLSLADVDVYMRYGMIDEAQRHLEMLLEQDSGHVEARCRLVKLLDSLDAEKDMNAAIIAGKLALEGDDLSRFEQAIDNHHEDVAEITPPDVDSDMLSLEEDVLVEDTPDLLSDIDIDIEDDTTMTEDVADSSDGLEFYLDDEDQPTDTQEVVNTQEEAANKEEILGGLELDLSDLESPPSSPVQEELDVAVTTDDDIDVMSVDDEMADILDALDLTPASDDQQLTDELPSENQEIASSEDVADKDELSDDFNVTSELDHLLDELDIDTACSLLAAGSLDQAEEKFKAAMTGGRCQALLGLADIAKQRGEPAQVEDFLSQAESLLDNKQDQAWFDRLRKPA